MWRSGYWLGALGVIAALLFVGVEARQASIELTQVVVNTRPVVHPTRVKINTADQFQSTCNTASTTGVTDSIGVAGNIRLCGYSIVTSVAGYLMLFDSTTVPANGTVSPIKCYGPLPANATVAADWDSGSRIYFSNGPLIAYSTTGCFTFTDSSTLDFASMDTQ